MDFHMVADAILSAARWYHEHGKWHLMLFLVMPDHLHMIVQFPNIGGGVGTHRPTMMEYVVGEFKKYLSRQFKIRFQRDFWDTRLRDDAHIAETFDYICHNPVRRGLCPMARDWPHVTAFDRQTGAERLYR